ncbi:MAG: hypothetical protein ABFD90_06270 [Phycisphaerales bacterium]
MFEFSSGSLGENATQKQKGVRRMRYHVLEGVLVAALIAGLSGCGVISKQEAKEDASAQQVPLSAVPEPARIAMEKLIAGGEIRKIEKEEVDGKVVYDVEATVGEKAVEYDVADDGTVLTAEESVPYASLPAVVRASAEKYFGSAAGLQASREVENGKTFYEVEGRRKGNAVALKLTNAGRIVEEEKQ